MPRRLVLTRLAEDDLSRMPQRDRAAVAGALDRLSEESGNVDIRKLEGRENEWRMRVGRWRVRFTYEDDSDAILILRILDRRDAYRH